MREYSLTITYKQIFHEGDLWEDALLTTKNVNVIDRGTDVLTEKQFLHDVAYQFTKQYLRTKGKLTGKITDMKIIDQREY